MSTPGQRRGPRPAGHEPDGYRPEGYRSDGERLSEEKAGGPKRGGHSEHETLAWLSKMLPAAPKGEVWAGDDAAAVAFPGAGPISPESNRLLLTTDTLVGGLDADLSLTSLSDFGWKAMAVNLSDIAAMGGVPGQALVSVVGANPEQLDLLYAGILEAAAAYNCPVVGGDLSGGTELVVSIALTGWADGPPVLRGGARPGDTIWVTGRLGAAAAGLRLLKAAGPPAPGASHHWTEEEGHLVRAHARPRPALVEGVLARGAGATAMIDVSDGLVADLSHIADLSGVGFDLVDIPVAPGATLAEALGGGDDYVLVFTMPSEPGPSEPGPSEPGPSSPGPPGSNPEIFNSEIFRSKTFWPTTFGSATFGSATFGPATFGPGLTPPYLIGTCLADPAQRLLEGRAVEVTGWDHSL